jgi:two-component system C4-dicarboxylate transport response regulator DctD
MNPRGLRQVRACAGVVRDAAPALPHLYRHSFSHLLVLGGSAREREQIALAFHRESALRIGPFIRVDCSSQEAQLRVALEWWLARSRRRDGPNPLWSAERGTLFLDEIDALSPAVQRLLLELICRGGSGAERENWAGRLAAGSSEDLADAVQQGRFLPALHDGLDKICVAVGATHQQGGAA